MKLKNAIAIMLAIAVMLLAGCSSSSEKETTASTTKPTTAKSADEMVLPFNDDGEFIFKSREIKYISVEQLAQEENDETACLNVSSEKDTAEFFKLLSEMQKQLIETEIKYKFSTESGNNVFPEIDLGSENYNVTMQTAKSSALIFLTQTAECSYFWFRTDTKEDSDNDYYSLYQISHDDYNKLAAFFGKLEKSTAGGNASPKTAKPVIYLYPEKETNVSVKLQYKGQLSVTYPEYGNGWNVRAYPDGHLINNADGLEYSYLFWDGYPSNPSWWNLSEGYCVAGTDTASFLQQTLSEMGMTPREYNEFIVYWLPLMQSNAYNLISFQWEEYEELAPLTIAPQPDSMLRLFMVFAPLDESMNIKAPESRAPFTRNGFTVVEWGGTEIKIK